jgi:hypothetical protein
MDEITRGSFMKKKQIYAIAAVLSLVGVVFTTGIVSNAHPTDGSTTSSGKEILKLDKGDAWTDFVPSTGRDNPVYVSEDEIIYTDSQGNKVFEYLNPVDPGNEPATMPDEGQYIESDVQGDVMTIEQTYSNTTSTDAGDSTYSQVPSTDVSDSTYTQSSSSEPVLVDTETHLATGTSRVIENENGLLIQVFE